jgi:leader peptidase (prepilin peptidase)/N-methyltransferase
MWEPGLPKWVGWAYWGAMGAAVGSFLNVCIYRIPRGESIVFPRSRCPHCAHPIPWYYNIPVLSWLWLRGRCAFCRGPISVRYFVVELWTALTYVGLFERWGWSPTFFILAVFLSLCIALFFIDLEWQILPNGMTIPGAAVGLLTMGPNALVTWESSLLGFGLGVTIPLGLIGLYWLVRQEEGMGLGDVKLLAMIGAFLGAGRLLMVLMIASVAGVLGGLVLWRLQRATPLGRVAVPFGTFLCGAAWLVVFWGDAAYGAYHRWLIRWYLGS